MNSDMEKWLEKQAHWQQGRRALSWPEKVHLAEQIRESIGKWGRSATKKTVKDFSHTRAKKKK